jgi:hypothetical protein
MEHALNLAIVGYDVMTSIRGLREVEMVTHVIKTKICKRGYLELKNLPFKEGTEIEISISKKEKRI